MNGLLAYIRSLDDYWFTPRAATAIGLFRIFLGTLVLANLILLTPDWETWFSERGYVPVALNRMWQGGEPYLWEGGPHIPRIAVMSWTTNPVCNQIFFGLLFIVSILTILGLWSRVSTILLAIGIVSLDHRNVMILHGGDTITRVMCVYLAWSPSGQACSLDRLIGLWRGKIGHGPMRVSPWVQRIIAYNLALCYVTTVWIKRFGVHWLDGTATWYTARLPEFYRFPVPKFLTEIPFVKITTWSTLFIELSMGTLVFYRPLRKYVLLAGLMLHASIDYSMNIPLFSFLMVSMYICFFDGEEIANWAAHVGRKLEKLHVTVRLPKDTQLKPNAVAVLDAIDPFKLVTYMPGDADVWTAHDAKDRKINGYWATLTHSLGAWPLAIFPRYWRRFLDDSVESIAAEPIANVS